MLTEAQHAALLMFRNKKRGGIDSNRFEADTCSRAVALKLQESGYIERQPGSCRGRITVLRLLEKGRSLLEAYERGLEAEKRARGEA